MRKPPPSPEQGDIVTGIPCPGDESDGYEPSLAPDPVDDLLEHSVLHLPKRADCPICQEAKQEALPARKVKGPRVLTDQKPSEHFGDRIHADYH